MNKRTLSFVASCIIATQTLANDELSSIYVTSDNLKITQKNATYSTEVYTQEDIQDSKAKDLFDFFNSQTSVTLTPNYGNKHTQLIDMRGYGATGYENVVVTLNGRRLNTIELVPQLISSVPVESVEKIEIIKGSGSVEYGDGANAGVINIVTKTKNSNYVKTYAGSNGLKYGIVSMGMNFENLIVNALIDHQSTDGSIEDPTGDKDDNRIQNKNINAFYFPTDDLEFSLSRTFTNMDTDYAKPISWDDYQSGNLNDTSDISGYEVSSYVTTAGMVYDINKFTSLDIKFSDENKYGKYSSGFDADNDNEYLSTSLNYGRDNYNVVLGYQLLDSQRKGSSDVTSKDSNAVFLSSNVNLFEKVVLSAGARTEEVEYEYNPNTGTTLNDDERLNAYNVGVNYQFDDKQSVFVNYNRSYQAPNIDRFFLYGGGFNTFIEPAKVRTYNAGYSYFGSKNQFKATVFRSDLTNEIYLEPNTYKNTNIDESHKYGLELFNKYFFSENIFTSINYNYIIAKIDEEDEGSGAYDGKYVPGVSKHNVTLNLGYKDNKYNAVLTHKYKSDAYAYGDFDNNNTQKQEVYNKTDLSLSYTYNKQIEFFGKVENIFDQSNGVWTGDNNIYVYDFERTFYAGMKVNF